MTEPQHEVALTPDEVEKILRECGPGTLLVGGQALAFWAAFYDVEPVGVLTKAITSDADFIGTAADARKLGAALKWTVWLPSMDDATAQTAKVTKLSPAGGVKQVDYLSAIAGLDTAKVQARAVEVTLPSGVTIRVLHPLDVLESRLRNIQLLSSKRSAVSVGQAELAIRVAAQFIASLLEPGADERQALNAIARVAAIAQDRQLVGVAVDYALDPLMAVPLARIANPEFHAKRWPQIVARVEALRQQHAKRTAVRKARRPGSRT